MVNALDEITYENPMGGGQITVAKNNTGTSDYNVYGVTYYLDEKGNKKSRQFTLPVLMYQNNIDQLFLEGKELLRTSAELYHQQWTEFHQKNK